jgi:nucleotide-binding universal stress UspA family protein
VQVDEPVLKKLVVPLDGSTLAKSALAPAQLLAERIDATLVLLTTRWRHSDIEAPTRYLDARCHELDRPAETRVVLDRDAPGAIVLAAQEPGTLVCMATHGHGGIERAALGSVAEAVVRNIFAPVLLVGPALSPRWSLPEAPVMLLGIDGSEHSRAAIPAAADLALAIGARVRILDVIRPPDVVAVSRFSVDDVDILEDSVERLAQRGVRSDYEVVDGFDAAETLVTDAAKLPASFIGVATHGRTGLARVAVGSVAMQVVRHAPCPVLVVRSQPLHGSNR